MFELAWANLTHHWVRTTLSALAVGLGIALMLVSKGLASGSIAEVASRMQSVDAELVVLPAQENLIFSGGAIFPQAFQRLIAKQADQRGPLATAVIPVFFGQVRMGGQQQRLFGVAPAQMPLFLGPRKLLDGKVFDRGHDFTRRVESGAATLPLDEADEAAMNAFLADGLELVIDDRLRRVGDGQAPYAVGQTVRIMGREFRIVGVIESGVAGRVFTPIQTMRQMLNAGVPWSSMFFVKLRSDASPVAALEQLAGVLGGSARVELKSDYGRLLRESFSQVNLYMNASSGLALTVCFLFILLTMYTTIVERTRELGILKSLGVTRGGLIGLSVLEALLICTLGVAIGIALAFAAKGLLGLALPLLTVELTGGQIALAMVIGVVGGALSALPPGWRSARLDPAVALNYE